MKVQVSPKRWKLGAKLLKIIDVFRVLIITFLWIYNIKIQYCLIKKSQSSDLNFSFDLLTVLHL